MPDVCAQAERKSQCGCFPFAYFYDKAHVRKFTILCILKCTIQRHHAHSQNRDHHFYLVTDPLVNSGPRFGSPKTRLVKVVGLGQRPRPPREVPAGRSPTRPPCGPFPPGKPHLCLLSPGCLGKLHTQPSRVSLPENIPPTANLGRCEDMSPGMLKGVLPSGGWEGICPALDLGHQGPAGTFPRHSWASWLPPTAQEFSRGGAGVEGGGTGLHMAVFVTGCALTGPAGTAGPRQESY